MKEQESEWISVSDLMTSIIAILVILIIVSLQNNSKVKQKLYQTEEILSKASKESEIKIHEQKKQDSILKSENLERIKFLQSFVDEINSESSNFVSLDSSGRFVIFQDGAFEESSPCLTASLKNHIEISGKKFLERLQVNEKVLIIVEGYTDTKPFAKVSSKKRRTPINCNGRSYFVDNNAELSVFRAQEARNALTEGWQTNYKERVIIAGYGSTKQIPYLGSGNRRVTISITN